LIFQKKKVFHKTPFAGKWIGNRKVYFKLGGIQMDQDQKNQQNLIDYERDKMGSQKKMDEFKDQGRVPDQQNRLKDQENLRK
jgi:hypothetical protein